MSVRDPITPAAASTRADAQRDRILCAALKCFIEHGFHAASMASIADSAQMSAGLIYRYFENKDAIVLAIVRRQLEEKRALIRQLQSADQLADGLAQAFEAWCSPGPGSISVALMLEMSAEATRNPEIAAALRESDDTTREEFEQWLCRRRDEGGLGMDPADAASRAVSIRLLLDGLAVRAARQPRLDREHVRAVLRDMVRRLLA